MKLRSVLLQRPPWSQPRAPRCPCACGRSGIEKRGEKGKIALPGFRPAAFSRGEGRVVGPVQVVPITTGG